ncbi:WYL domain-containing protein [bacterium]|nr:WYL domain-containing protein [bacterium]
MAARMRCMGTDSFTAGAAGVSHPEGCLCTDTMPRNFSRHEQFLRIFALLETLSNTRQPLDDQAVITTLKERLGLSKLSVRTLHRDCDFLISCGYPVDHVPLPEGRRHGWRIDKDALAGRALPAEPITLLELVAFMVGRELLRTFEGTVLWTGMESLRHKIEQAVPPQLLERLEHAKNVFHVAVVDPARYASRPRLISALSTAITDCREIEVSTRHGGQAGAAVRHRLQPLRLIIQPPVVQLLGLDVQRRHDPPLLIDIDRIEAVQTLDTTFSPPAIDVAQVLGRGPVVPRGPVKE